jgi:hypothetical protein
MAQINEKDITSKDLRRAFDHLSAHVKTAFPTILPMEVFTVGGAMIVIVLGTSTHDVDVSGKLLEARYGGEYRNIKTTFLELCAQTFSDLKGHNVDLGSEKWLNYAVDN